MRPSTRLKRPQPMRRPPMNRATGWRAGRSAVSSMNTPTTVTSSQRVEDPVRGGVQLEVGERHGRRRGAPPCGATGAPGGARCRRRSRPGRCRERQRQAGTSRRPLSIDVRGMSSWPPSVSGGQMLARALSDVSNDPEHRHRVHASVACRRPDRHQEGERRAARWTSGHVQLHRRAGCRATQGWLGTCNAAGSRPGPDAVGAWPGSS